MPANVGHMFYTGDVPWHGEGTRLDEPANAFEALKHGHLDWEVKKVPIQTVEGSPSPTAKRVAVVRTDAIRGSEERVLGIVHKGFVPLQNQQGILMFDSLYGRGGRVYHTGGYLGNGEVVWLLAKVGEPLEVGPGDVIQPYALYANSHDGSLAICVQLTTIRVVCENTLAWALEDKQFGQGFRRAHQGSAEEITGQAHEFWEALMAKFEWALSVYRGLRDVQFNEAVLDLVLLSLFPDPKPPRNASENPGLNSIYEKRLKEAQRARKTTRELIETGRGSGLTGVRGTFWGLLNAAMEFVDHHQVPDEKRFASTVFGNGMRLKKKALQVISEQASRVA